MTEPDNVTIDRETARQSFIVHREQKRERVQ